MGIQDTTTKRVQEIMGDINVPSSAVSKDLGLGAAANAHTWIYVRPTGSDTAGDGSLARPYATLEKALSVIPLAFHNGKFKIDITGMDIADDVVIPMCKGGEEISCNSQLTACDTYTFEDESVSLYGYAKTADIEIVSSLVHEATVYTADAWSGTPFHHCRAPVVSTGAGWTPGELSGAFLVAQDNALYTIVDNTADTLFIDSKIGAQGITSFHIAHCGAEISDRLYVKNVDAGIKFRGIRFNYNGYDNVVEKTDGICFELCRFETSADFIDCDNVWVIKSTWLGGDQFTFINCHDTFIVNCQVDDEGDFCAVEKGGKFTAYKCSAWSLPLVGWSSYFGNWSDWGFELSINVEGFVIPEVWWGAHDYGYHQAKVFIRLGNVVTFGNTLEITGPGCEAYISQSCTTDFAGAQQDGYGYPGVLVEDGARVKFDLIDLNVGTGSRWLGNTDEADVDIEGTLISWDELVLPTRVAFIDDMDAQATNALVIADLVRDSTPP